MNGLVGYGSSDEEDEGIPERPAKIAKTSNNAPDHLAAPLETPTVHPEAPVETQPLKASTIDPPTKPQIEPPQPTVEPSAPASGPAPGPAPVLSLTEPTASVVAPTSPPPAFSPYTFTRQRLRDLTMPPVPNFALPDAPSPPPQNSEAAATLAQTSKQFERFLALKKQGVHFNERLQNSASLRNPSLLPKLLAFAGIEGTEAYESSLGQDLGVPVEWPEDCFVEGLVRGNERRERKKGQERERVDFVPAKGGGGSGTSTPGGGEGRKSKFDKR